MKNISEHRQNDEPQKTEKKKAHTKKTKYDKKYEFFFN
jgi:hypothetical protein